LRRLDYRMHNKLLVVDNALALVGGRNVANEYFQIDPELRFADEDADRELRPGDWLDIAPHRRHRVAWTAPGEATVWLAVHYADDIGD
jgi:phosphatidylserine/phosphatidylglycerophosphate/cardiolipin synthase-like enzyme